MNRYKLTKAGIDYNEAVRRFSGDKEMYESLLVKFLDDDGYQKTVDLVKSENCPAAFQAAHALKGIVGNLSLVELYAAILPMVEDLRSDSLESARSHLPAVVEAYNMATKAIRECM